MAVSSRTFNFQLAQEAITFSLLPRSTNILTQLPSFVLSYKSYDFSLLLLLFKGDACAARFHKEGYSVAMVARTASNLRDLESKLPGSKGYAASASGTPEEIGFLIDQIEADLGPIHTLIYNAGGGPFRTLENITFKDFEDCFKGGPFGLFNFAKVLAPAMAARGGGAIGVTGATASWRGMPSTPGFASAKFGTRLLLLIALRPLCHSSNEFRTSTNAIYSPFYFIRKCCILHQRPAPSVNPLPETTPPSLFTSFTS